MSVKQHRTFRDGICVQCETIDYDSDSFTLEVDGVVVKTRALTPEERQMYGPQPLGINGVQATLLAVFELIPLIDAANAVGLTPEDLTQEALGWQVMKDAGLA
jgi:hypothetical protein